MKQDFGGFDARGKFQQLGVGFRRLIQAENLLPDAQRVPLDGPPGGARVGVHKFDLWFRHFLTPPFSFEACLRGLPGLPLPVYSSSALQGKYEMPDSHSKKDNKAFRSQAPPCGAMKPVISVRIYCGLAEQTLP
jgi:hypothetical protein